VTLLPLAFAALLSAAPPAPASAPVRARVLVAGNPLLAGTIWLGSAHREADAEGRVSFDRCEGFADIVARGGGRVSRQMAIDCLAPPAGEISLELGPPAIVSGHVLSAEGGAPIADAEIGIQGSAAAWARTDASGAYRLDGVAPGVRTVLARAKGRLVARIEAVEAIAGKSVALDLSLLEASFAEGSVRGPGGEAVEGAQVVVRGADGVELGSARTRADGLWRVEGLPRGVGTLEVRDRRAPKGRSVIVPSTGNVLELSRACAVEGAVRASSGKPAEGAEVVLQPKAGAVQGTRSDPQGKFSFADAGGGDFVLVARLAGSRSDERTRSPAEACGGPFSLVLRETTTVDGLLVVGAEDGRPIAGGHVGLVTRWGAPIAGDEAGATSDSEGRFTLSGVAAPLMFKGSATGFQPRTKRVLSPPGLSRDVPLARLRLFRRLHLQGRVIDPAGDAVRTFRICDEYLGDSREFVECEDVHSADGRFEVWRDDPRLPSAPRKSAPQPRLAIVAHGFEAAVRALSPLGATLTDLGDVALQPEVPLSVRVVDPAGKPVPGARIERGEAGAAWSWAASADGTGEAKVWLGDDPMRGSCFRATHPLWPTSRFGECLYEQGQARERITVTFGVPGWSVGSAPPGATVVDLKVEGMSAVVGKDGRYRLGPLEAGEHAPALIEGAAPSVVDGPEAADRVEKLSLVLEAGEEKVVDLQR
jgi:hypothetical protein